MAFDGADQRTFAVWPIDDDPDTAIACERENARFDVPFDGTVGDLNKIERLATHDLFDLRVASTFGGRDAHVTYLARGLHREKRRQMFLP